MGTVSPWPELVMVIMLDSGWSRSKHHEAAAATLLMMPTIASQQVKAGLLPAILLFPSQAATQSGYGTNTTHVRLPQQVLKELLLLLLLWDSFCIHALLQK